MDFGEEVDQNVSPEVHAQLMNLHIGNIVQVNPDIKNYYKEVNAEDGTNGEPWASKPELPSSDEILGTDLPENEEDCVELMPNRIKEPWPSKDSYLRAHYELLREDAVAPLRDAVAYVRDDPRMMDSKDVSIYEKVYIVGMTFAQRGLAFRIQFSTSRAGKNIVWEYSKRLISGTIVALTPTKDYFRTKCAVGVVAARPLEGVKQQPPEIDIFFARPEDVDFDPHKEWVMVEAKIGYYESLRHTMTALQKMRKESFPLADHICSLDPNVDAPQYIKERPVIDIQSSLEESREAGRVNILEDWPKSPTGDLDATQWAALEQILTRKLSIIQGPPGTGKTFVSVVALKIMLANMKYGDPPIFIAAQTNHALDQLLNHISSFESSYIRLGARSGDPEIRRRTLFAIRQREPTATIRGSVFPTARKKYRNFIVSVSELLQPFIQEDEVSPLPSSLFVKHGTLSWDQYDSLEKGAKGWVRPGTDDDTDTDPLVAWMGDEGVEFKVKYSKENFGFLEDEVDLEYEQLKELEAEQGLEEDEYDGLRGQFTGLRDNFRGRDIGSVSEAAALDYLKCFDMWKIPPKARGAVYNVLRKLTKEKILSKFRQLLALYNANCENLQIGKWERDHTILRNVKVIGMTTTGLSKYRALLSSLNPWTVLIEEAAEVIEAPISVSCFNSLQQLILVGDHQQLRGHCSVQDLEGDPFYLDVSMFERLVKNKMKYITLLRQRRMAPEIRRLLGPIYGELQDHPSVEQRPPVPGMGNYRSYFFSHIWPENSDSLSSKFNELEAHMVVGFYAHLVLNGISVNNITILTFYNGQRKRIMKLLKAHPYLQGHYMKVVTVDSYQGEENDIVILSLVRSGQNNKIGFLSIENRVCVALSRARQGFYIFGNSIALSNADPVWFRVISIMNGVHDEPETRRLGFALPLTCSKHGRKTLIKEPSGWEKINGGCDWYCNGTLKCGHNCTMLCHSLSHDQVVCNRICHKPFPCGHKCDKPCSINHFCVCKCQLIAEAAAVEDSPPHEPVVTKKLSEKETLRRKLINDYQAFANGGAQEHDAVLNAKVTAREKGKMKKKKSKKSASGILVGDLLGEGGSSGAVNTVKYSPVENIKGYEQDQAFEGSESQDPSSQSAPQWSLLD